MLQRWTESINVGVILTTIAVLVLAVATFVNGREVAALKARLESADVKAQEPAEHPDAWTVLDVSYSGCGEADCAERIAATGVRQTSDRYGVIAARVTYLNPEHGQPVVEDYYIGSATAEVRWWRDCIERIEEGQPLPTCARLPD